MKQNEPVEKEKVDAAFASLKFKIHNRKQKN